jgi:hypothetical protein
MYQSYPIKYLKLEPLIGGGGGHWTAVLAKLGMKLKVGMKTVHTGWEKEGHHQTGCLILNWFSHEFSLSSFGFALHVCVPFSLPFILTHSLFLE